jgi:hypothetical protein
MAKSFNTISEYIFKLDKFRRDGQVSDADIFKAFDRNMISKKDSDWVTGQISDLKVEGYVDVQRDNTVFPSRRKYITFTDKAIDVLEGRANANSSNEVGSAIFKNREDSSRMTILEKVELIKQWNRDDNDWRIDFSPEYIGEKVADK